MSLKHSGLSVFSVIFLVAFSFAVISNPVRAENQPLMKMALKHLQVAKSKLKKASHDKGGHRVKAMEHIEKAIAEVQKGIHHDNANKKK